MQKLIFTCIWVMQILIPIFSQNTATIQYDTISIFDENTFTEHFWIVKRDGSEEDKFQYCKGTKMALDCYFIQIENGAGFQLSSTGLHISLDADGISQFSLDYFSDATCRCIQDIVYLEVEITDRSSILFQKIYKAPPFEIPLGFIPTDAKQELFTFYLELKNQVLLLKNGTTLQLPDRVIAVSTSQP